MFASKKKERNASRKMAGPQEVCDSFIKLHKNFFCKYRDTSRLHLGPKKSLNFVSIKRRIFANKQISGTDYHFKNEVTQKKYLILHEFFGSRWNEYSM